MSIGLMAFAIAGALAGFLWGLPLWALPIAGSLLVALAACFRALLLWELARVAPPEE
jgi:hypothetical protein